MVRGKLHQMCIKGRVYYKYLWDRDKVKILFFKTPSLTLINGVLVNLTFVNLVPILVQLDWDLKYEFLCFNLFTSV